MQEQKYSLNKKIFFKSENLTIVLCKISKFTQRIRNWFNKELSPSQELPHEFKELDTGIRHSKRYLKGSSGYEDTCLACNPSKF